MPMSGTHAPTRGTIITYLNPDGHGRPFLRAVVSGPGIPDPETDLVWLPVHGTSRPGLVDPDQIVDITPSGPRTGSADALARRWSTPQGLA
jgi:hypothetical protein